MSTCTLKSMSVEHIASKLNKKNEAKADQTYYISLRAFELLST